jgi:cysteinyl-tRNA synthetase
MAMKYLGETLDIHVGGVDLIFPHHENEIAQSEAATGKEFVRYFVHGEHMAIDGKKMSKSLGNVYDLGSIKEHGIDPLAYRYLILTAHYRSKLNFTWESLEGAAKTLESIKQLAYRTSATELTDERRREILEAGTTALENDLDTPKLLALLHDAGSYDLWLAFEPVLGLGLTEVVEDSTPTVVTDLLMQRQAAKIDKNFSLADQLRTEIEGYGYLVEDAADGTRVVPKG